MHRKASNTASLTALAEPCQIKFLKKWKTASKIGYQWVSHESQLSDRYILPSFAAWDLPVLLRPPCWLWCRFHPRGFGLDLAHRLTELMSDDPLTWPVLHIEGKLAMWAAGVSENFTSSDVDFWSSSLIDGLGSKFNIGMSIRLAGSTSTRNGGRGWDGYLWYRR